MIQERISKIIEEVGKEYSARTQNSRRLFDRAYRVLPGGATYHTRLFSLYPIYVKRAKGTRVWDVDDNEYIDLWMGHGTHILGHLPDIVVEAVRNAHSIGTHLGFENPYAIEFAELLSRVVPGVEMVRFTNSGTESNMYALRLARAYAKRNYVIKIEGGWHGGYDGLHVAVSPPFKGPESAGLPEDFIKYTFAVPYNDLEAVEEAHKKYNPAAVIVEPVIGAGGCIAPSKDYLRGLREISDRYGSLLIFDEVITGFRLAPGGAQEYFGVRADIVTMGKIMGGGYAGAGAFGGRADVMELLDHIKHPNPRERSFHGGTFTGNVISMIAGKTIVEYLSRRRDLYEGANALWDGAIEKADRICESYDRLCWSTGTATLLGIHFTASRPKNVREAYELRIHKNIEAAFHLYSRNRGIIFMSEKMPHILASLVHERREAEAFLEALESFLAELVKR